MRLSKSIFKTIMYSCLVSRCAYSHKTLISGEMCRSNDAFQPSSWKDAQTALGTAAAADTPDTLWTALPMCRIRDISRVLRELVNSLAQHSDGWSEHGQLRIVPYRAICIFFKALRRVALIAVSLFFLPRNQLEST